MLHLYLEAYKLRLSTMISKLSTAMNCHFGSKCPTYPHGEFRLIRKIDGKIGFIPNVSPRIFGITLHFLFSKGCLQFTSLDRWRWSAGTDLFVRQVKTPRGRFISWATRAHSEQGHFTRFIFDTYASRILLGSALSIAYCMVINKERLWILSPEV